MAKQQLLAECMRVQRPRSAASEARETYRLLNEIVGLKKRWMPRGPRRPQENKTQSRLRFTRIRFIAKKSCMRFDNAI